MQMPNVVGRLPTIPEYFTLYINKNVDLTVNPKQICPFHDEDAPSWSYSADKGVWRCFGGCKCGGDVVDLHKKNFKLKSRELALRDLSEKHRVERTLEDSVNDKTVYVNEDKIELDSVYQEALILANGVERWLELDIVMSMTPVNVLDLKELVNRWKGRNNG